MWQPAVGPSACSKAAHRYTAFIQLAFSILQTPYNPNPTLTLTLPLQTPCDASRHGYPYP
eukprot:scaffold127129_cov36-Phaeocystis_antarctica.AAC.2